MRNLKLNMVYLIIAILYMISATEGSAWTPALSSPMGQITHPRLLITANDTTRLSYLAAGARYANIRILAAGNVSGGMQNSNLKWQTVIAGYVAMSENAAGRDKSAYVAKVRDIAINYLVPATFDTGNGWDAALTRANIIAGLSLAYDWCYNDLSTTDRQTIRDVLADRLAKIKQNAEGTPVPPAVTVWSGHDAYHNIYFLDRGVYIMGMAAIGLDNPGLPDVQAMLDAAKGYKDNIVSAINVAQKNGGGWQEGWHYWFDNEGPLRWMPMELASWQTATEETVFRDASHLEGMALNTIYALKPNLLLDRVDETIDGSDMGSPSRMGLLLLSKVYGNGYFKYLANLSAPYGTPTDYRQGALSALEMFFDDGTIPGKTPSDISALPPTYFSEGMGTAYIRDSVGGVNGLFSSFRSKPFYNDHENPENNSFNIYYNGDMTGKSGYYMGWGADHTMTYLRKSISANTVLVEYPGGTAGYGVKDGGQLVPGYDTIQGQSYGSAKFEDNPFYALAIGDATNSYKTDQLTKFVRHFMYLKNMKTFVVRDIVVSANASYQKKWLLHTPGEPVLYSGNNVVSNNMPPGFQSFANVDRLVAVNGGGKLTLIPVFPAGVNFRKLGGAGYQFWVDLNTPANYANSAMLNPDLTLKTAYSSAMSWRVEVMPATAAATDIFLNVIDVTDAMDGIDAIVTRFASSTGNAKGVQITKGDNSRIVLFCDNDSTAAVSYTIPTAVNPSVHIIGNLAPQAKYKIVKSGNVVSVTSDSSGQYTSTANGILLYSPVPKAPGSIYIH